MAHDANIMQTLLYLILKDFKQLRNNSFPFFERVPLLFLCACFPAFLLFWSSKITACWYSDLWGFRTLRFSSSGIPLLKYTKVTGFLNTLNCLIYKYQLYILTNQQHLDTSIYDTSVGISFLTTIATAWVNHKIHTSTWNNWNT